MDDAKFFAETRKLTGPLLPVQVQVIEAILKIADCISTEHLAYILATGWGEAKLTPVRENMYYRAPRIKQVWPTRPEAVKFAGKPVELANCVYGGRIGNRPGTDDGWVYRGGGVDQLTGRENYAKLGLENNPEAILDPDAAARSIVHGMTTGRYTGKRLDQYGDGATFNAQAARAIVNGDVKANGAKYAGYYATFKAALEAAGYTPAAVPAKPGQAVPVAVATGLAAMVAALWQWGSDMMQGMSQWFN